MTVLKYAAQVRSPAGYSEELADCDAAEEELALATTLVDQTTRREFDLARYKDEYAEKLMQLIDAAVHGKELVAVPSDEPRQVLNLLDALKASVAQGASPDENGAAHDALAKQLSRPRGQRKAAAKRSTSKPGGSRRRFVPICRRGPTTCISKARRDGAPARHDFHGPVAGARPPWPSPPRRQHERPPRIRPRESPARRAPNARQMDQPR